ncbi:MULTISPECIES: hypothetical protein [unclassified Corynebacterium]|uniref:hypothetical protein n=1 Tax=unclassified Corynebacterium TaxID=2624378 RepID=UPI0029CA8048|nr:MULTISPECIES: hypothetical protein [unclassified Corynebacterium]WPF66061.1 hypothetical protein OLX12_11005 [Corynebacterium sp. 22KM0430]WPF68553.1 hypothetical protein OLW90_11000 [Corynebacterium sp. 21KM1197]
MSVALWLCRVDWDVVVRLLQVLVAGVGLSIAQQGLRYTVRTLAQKTESDNRAEWWKRYTWAMEKVYDEREEVMVTGWELIDCLSQSPLATHTEVEIINFLIVQRSEHEDSEEG